MQNRATAQAVSRRFLTAEAEVRIQEIPYAICGPSGNGTDISPSPSVFSCQYSDAPHSLMHHLGPIEAAVPQRHNLTPPKQEEKLRSQQVSKQDILDKRHVPNNIPRRLAQQQADKSHSGTGFITNVAVDTLASMLLLGGTRIRSVFVFFSSKYILCQWITIGHGCFILYP
jgi:hypothetical protein